MNDFVKRNLDSIGVLMGAVFFVGLGFMAQRLLDWDRPCLRFDGVIELHVDGYMDGVRSCQRTSRFQNNHLPDRVRKFVDDVNELKRISVLFPNNMRGVFVTITEKDPFFLLLSERSVVIGSEIANNTRALQKVILSAVAFQSFAGLESMGKELRADLLWYFFAGDEEWTDPTMGFSVDPKQWLRLAGAPTTLGDYCSSPIRQIFDLSLCRYELDKKQPLALIKRYQSLISWTAFKTLKRAGFTESTTYLRSIFSGGTNPTSSSFNREDVESSLDLAESFVREEVLNLLQADEGRLPAFENASFNQQISRVWKSHKITSDHRFDFVVEVENQKLMDVILNSLTEWQKTNRQAFGAKVLLLNGDEQIELPLAQKVYYPIDQVKSETHLILACRLPGVQTVAGFSSEQLIALKVCDSSDLPQWAEILKESGSTKHTASLRLDIHVPSLKRWSRYQAELLALNPPMDEVFCRAENYQGYPFRAINCPPSRIQ